MKLWKKIAIGVAIIVVYAGTQANSESITQKSVDLPAQTYQTQPTVTNFETVQSTTITNPKQIESAPVYQKTVPIETASNQDSPSVQPEAITVPVATSPVNSYVNSAGNEVQSPTAYDSQPEGATAKCKDGTYSFSQSRKGTCSGHGGVGRWL